MPAGQRGLFRHKSVVFGSAHDSGFSRDAPSAESHADSASPPLARWRRRRSAVHVAFSPPRSGGDARRAEGALVGEILGGRRRRIRSQPGSSTPACTFRSRSVRSPNPSRDGRDVTAGRTGASSGEHRHNSNTRQRCTRIDVTTSPCRMQSTLPPTRHAVDGRRKGRTSQIPTRQPVRSQHGGLEHFTAIGTFGRPRHGAEDPIPGRPSGSLLNYRRSPLQSAHPLLHGDVSRPCWRGIPGDPNRLHGARGPESPGLPTLRS